MMIISVIWFVTSIPIITIGASTTALYYTVVKCIRMNRGYMIKEYFKSWKQNFFKATVMTLLLLVICLFLLTWMSTLGASLEDIITNGMRSAFKDKSEQLVELYMVCGIVLVIVGMLFTYMFPLLSRLDISTMQIIFMSFVLAIRYIYFSVLLLVILYGFVLFVKVMPPAIILAPGCWAYMSSFLIEKAMKKYLPVPEEGQDAWWVGL
ncbi:MAG: DUF624 domain-containing protein [Lachnospiraceae bacterium]|nr:DUF624 domain-containing protein [Lachnospiraceae bacterium]